ncbi:MAG TPA: hypothetical protein VGU71_19950 [Candidatus Dormibacteraeota bacterium]|nr:hypothetical protein [Candidatus Dormibacteraeota bacterium]
MRRLALVAVLAVACGAATAHAQTLALAYKGGDTYKYALHSIANESVDAGAMSIPIKLDLSAVETVKVKSVDSSGTADLSLDLSNVVMKSSYSTTTSTTTGTPMGTISMKVAADGRILSVNGNSFGSSPFTSFSGGGGAFISAVLPDKKVSPKDTWSKDFDQANPMGTGTIHVTTSSTYLRDESLKGINAAVVETKTNGTIDITIDMAKAMAGAPSSTPTIPPGMFQSLSMKGTVTSTVTSWIDPSGHRVIKTHKIGNVNATMTFVGGTGPALPGLSGPTTIKGDETTDLNPA